MKTPDNLVENFDADPPESVNSQNPIAKCGDKALADVLAAAIEKRELGGSVASPTVARRRSASL